MLSKTSEYALRSVIYIAMQSDATHKVGIKEIAKELDLPLHFVGKILQDLVRKGVIASVKGPNGGFYLPHDPGDMTIMDVVRVVDGVEAFKRCGLGLKNCSDDHPCPLHHDFKTYRDGLATMFARKTIKDLVGEIERGHAFIKNLDGALPGLGLPARPR